LSGATLSLTTADYKLDVLPDLGGAIGSFRWQHPNGRWLDLMRPLHARPGQAPTVLDAASFPMTPFCNRIREGKFTFGGHRVELPRNLPGSHPIHGHGWQRPWQVMSASQSQCDLLLMHQPDAWPWPYQFRQTFVLERDGLRLTMIAQNTGRERMPIGFGAHPYFPRTPQCRLTAKVAQMWETDGDVLPIAKVSPWPSADPSSGLRVAPIALDHVFTEWDGSASIDWPELFTRLAITASEPLRHLCVYVPPGQDFFCVEPVSNITDAINLAASGQMGTGLLEIAPKESNSATIKFGAVPLGDQ
jgi:aldose 1-epimerase